MMEVSPIDQINFASLINTCFWKPPILNNDMGSYCLVHNNNEPILIYNNHLTDEFSSVLSLIILQKTFGESLNLLIEQLFSENDKLMKITTYFLNEDDIRLLNTSMEYKFVIEVVYRQHVKINEQIHDLILSSVYR